MTDFLAKLVTQNSFSLQGLQNQFPQIRTSWCPSLSLIILLHRNTHLQTWTHTGLNAFENVINAEGIEIDVWIGGCGARRSSDLIYQAGGQQELQELPAIAAASPQHGIPKLHSGKTLAQRDRALRCEQWNGSRELLLTRENINVFFRGARNKSIKPKSVSLFTFFYFLFDDDDNVGPFCIGSRPMWNLRDWVDNFHSFLFSPFIFTKINF